MPGLVRQAVAAGMGKQEAQRRATLRGRQQVRDGTIGLVEAAITELAVAPLPLAPPRGRAGEPEPQDVARYARGVLSPLARHGSNRPTAEMRARHPRLTAHGEDYREVFEQIVGLENRRMRIAQQS